MGEVLDAPHAGFAAEVGHRADAAAVGEHVVGELGLRRLVVGRPVDADDERQAVVALGVDDARRAGRVVSAPLASAAVLAAERVRATAVTIAVPKTRRFAIGPLCKENSLSF